MTILARTVKLVRLREGVYVTGKKVPEGVSLYRVPHLVDVAVDLDAPYGVAACCGVEFAPGTLMDVPWLELLPHPPCLRRSPWPARLIEADFLAANVMRGPQELPAGLGSGALAILGVIPEVAASIAAADRIFVARDGWARDPEGVPTWEYLHSFNGVLGGEKRFPRNHDLGITPLMAEVVKPDVLRISSGGVLGTCPDHAVRSETVSLDDAGLVEERLTGAERQARSVDLVRLSSCLIAGPCSDIVPDTTF